MSTLLASFTHRRVCLAAAVAALREKHPTSKLTKWLEAELDAVSHYEGVLIAYRDGTVTATEEVMTFTVETFTVEE